jgi:hypothetical protein
LLGIAALNEKALAVMRWRPVQWQTIVNKGDPGACAAKPSTDAEAPRFSASSLIFDLNDATKTARTKHRSPIVPPA